MIKNYFKPTRNSTFAINSYNSICFLLFIVLFVNVSSAQTTLFQFNFENNTNPSIDNVIGTPVFSSNGLGTVDYTTTNPCQGSRMLTADDWDTSNYYRFTVNTSGFSNMNFSFCNRTDNTQIGTFIVRVSSDNGANWTTVLTSYTPTTSNNTLTTSTFPTIANNSSDVWIEIYKTNNANSNNRDYLIDNVILTGYLIPTITSFTPSSGCSNTTPVVITGTNFTGVTGVTFGGINAASYVVNSSTQITAIPAAGSTGAIAVTTSGGTATSGSSFTVNSIPTVTSSASPTSITSGGTTTLTASATPATESTVLLSEGFNGATNSWTKINNSTGGTPANAAWTLRPNGYTYNYSGYPSYVFNSNDNSQFYLSNSAAQGNATTETILQSPVMNSVGYTSLSLEFYQFNLDYDNTDFSRVEVSTNGTAWTTLTTTTTTQGTINNFLQTTVNLNAYINQPTLYIRFRYNAQFDWFWAIDNVTVSGNKTIPYTYSWTASPSGTAGLPAGAGTTSTSNNSIVASPTANTAYTVTATNPNGGCTGTSVVNVSVCPAYSLTSVAAVATACTTTKTTNVTLTSTAAGLPVGTYTVSYSLSYNSYSTSYTAPMTVTTAGTGQFTASLSIMNANESTNIRINNLALGSCNNAISSNNVSNTVNQYQPITPTAYSGYSSCSTWYAQWQNDTFVSGYFLDVATTSNFATGTYVPGFQDLNVGNVIVYPITGLTPGTTYYYRIRNNNLGCGVSGNSNVISFVAGGANAPTIGTITHPTCSTATGSFTITNYVSWHNYTISPSTGVSRSGAVVTAPPGSYTITDSNSGCTSAATSFTINAQPVSSVAPTGVTGTNTICNGTSTVLTLTGGTAGSGTATWYSGSCAGTAVGTGNSITVSPTSTTTYYVRYEGGCNTTTCASRTVTVNNFVTTANAGPDQSLANATSFTLAANTPTVGTGVWTIVSGPSTSLSQFSSATSPTATFTPSITGTYVLSWTISNSCNSTTDQVVIANNCVSNLITNGDFSGGSTGWTNATTQGNYVEVYSEDVYFNTGNSSLTAELDSEASLRQTLTVIPGVSYTVSFRYARRPTTGTPATTGVTIKVTGGTSDIISTGFTTTTTMAQIASFTFTPTSATIGLEFYNTLHGGITLGTIIDDIVLLPASQAAPVAVTNPKGVFNTSTSCAGVAVSLDVENVPASGVSYLWTGSSGTVFSATNIKNPTVTFTGSGLQQATVTVITAGGCSVTSTTYVNVAAAPTITAPLATSVCSGSTYSSGPITSTGNAFDWSRAAVPNINGGAAATGGTNIAKGVGFTEVLTNSSTSPVDVTYVLIPRSPSSSCAGIQYNLVITVNPGSSTPVLASTVQPTCVTPYGSVVLNGLPATGIITQTGAVNATYTISGGGTQTITNLSGGTYSFTATISGGCVSAATANVVINTPPGTNTWTGTWSNGTPTAEQKVIFNADYSSTTDVEACSCQVNNAKVVFNSGHTLKITYDLEVKPVGTLTFENNASLVQINDAAVNTGNIIYHRYTSAVKRYDFTYWSSPVEGQILKNLSPNTLYDKYYSYNNGWQIIYNGAAPMTVGKGYIIRAPQTFSITMAAVDTNPTFIGKPNNGVYLVPVVGNQVQLLGNPYPSALDANAFLDANSSILEGTIYFWTHNSPPSSAVGTYPGNTAAIYNYTTNDYAAYNRTGGVATAAAITGGAEPNGKIASGQGFFAAAKATGNVVYRNSMRLNSSTGAVLSNSQFFKLNTSKTATTNATATTTTAIVAAEDKNRIWLNLTNSEGAFKQTLVGYMTGATNNYEGNFDGLTYDGNQYLDFYSVNQAVKYTIQGRALPFAKQDTVALGYKSTIAGQFQISIDHTDGILSTQSVFIEDKNLNVIYDLKKGPYTFTTEKGVFDNRFVLRYVDKNAIEEVVIPDKTDETVDLNNKLLVVVKQGVVTIKSLASLLQKVRIYDVRGKSIYLNHFINSEELVINNLNTSHQVLIVHIIMENGKKHVQKIVY